MEKIHANFTPYSAEEGVKKNQKISLSLRSTDNSSGMTSLKEATDYYSENYKYDVYDVEGLEKTENEKKLIMMAQDAFDAFFEDIGVAGEKFDIDEIHVLNKKEYEDKIKENRANDDVAKFSYGHVYCQRDTDRDFLRVLTHELAHKASYYNIGIKKENKINDVSLKRTGFDHEVGGRRLFDGFNEAVTEFISKEVLSKICSEGSFLKDDCKYMIKDTVSYYGQTLVVYELVKKFSEGDKKKNEALWLDIFRAYFNGNYYFLKDMEKKQSGVIKILREMGKGDDDAYRAAKILGLPKAKEIIKSYIDDIR